MSPTWIFSTAPPTSITSPTFSWPKIRPCSKSVRPSYMCRSEPQMLVLVIRTSASVGFSMRASGTSSTLTLRGPWYTTAFMGDLLTVLDLRDEPQLTSGPAHGLRSQPLVPGMGAACDSGNLAPAPDLPKRGPAVPLEGVFPPRLSALPRGGEQAVRRDVGARADPLLVGDERSVDVVPALQV